MRTCMPSGPWAAISPTSRSITIGCATRRTGTAGSLWDYSLNWLAAKQARFARLERIADTPLAGLTWAFHFDASLYAAYLSRFAQGLGVRRVDAKIAGALQGPTATCARSSSRTGASSRRTSSSTAPGFAAC